MTKEEFQSYIHEQIPITTSMAIEVTAFDGKTIKLKAGIKENINHRESAFGGSISSLLILTGWAKIYHLLSENHMKGTIVIQSSRVSYLAPVTQDFEAEIDPLEENNLDLFISMLLRFRKSRLTLTASVYDKNKRLAAFSGDYVVFLDPIEM